MIPTTLCSWCWAWFGHVGFVKQLWDVERFPNWDVYRSHAERAIKNNYRAYYVYSSIFGGHKLIMKIPREQ